MICKYHTVPSVKIPGKWFVKVGILTQIDLKGARRAV